MAGGRFEMAMEPTAIGLVSLNSNSETHMTAICDARLIYGRGWISRVFICCATLKWSLISMIFMINKPVSNMKCTQIRHSRVQFGKLAVEQKALNLGQVRNLHLFTTNLLLLMKKIAYKNTFVHMKNMKPKEVISFVSCTGHESLGSWYFWSTGFHCS